MAVFLISEAAGCHDGADYAVARSPAEAREYVEHIRLAEAMLGSGERQAMPCEQPYLRYRVGAEPA